MSDILLYGGIYEWTVERFIKDLNASGKDVTVRVNSDGGSPSDAMGLIAVLQDKQKKGKVKLCADGKANSMASFLFCYVDDTECLETTTFGIHRAGYSSYIEDDPQRLTQAMKDERDRINAFLRPAFEAKIDANQLYAIKGITVDELFSTETRKLVILNAQEAKQIGLVKKVIPITPEKKMQIEASLKAFEEAQTRLAASFSGTETTTTQTNENNKKNNIMTAQDLKNSHPAVFAEIYNSGVTAGIDQENDRVGSWAVHYATDPEKVTAAIKTKGKTINATETQELLMAAFAKGTLTAMKNENAGDIGNNPLSKEPTGVDAKMAQIEKELFAHMGIQQPK